MRLWVTRDERRGPYILWASREPPKKVTRGVWVGSGGMKIQESPHQIHGIQLAPGECREVTLVLVPYKTEETPTS